MARRGGHDRLRGRCHPGAKVAWAKRLDSGTLLGLIVSSDKVGEGHLATSTSSGRFAPLDGMRAFAVLAVILFHAYTPWAVGGYYGVDVFFVLSGYLITGLLVSEWRRRDTISLGHFWARRARRLLPALLVMLAVVLLVADIWPSVLGSPGLWWDSVATVFYSSNWRFMAEHANYFTAASNPSPLLHTWTLAIEEQFYLLWPLVVFGVLAIFARRERGALEGSARVTRRRSSRRAHAVLLAIAALGAVASAVVMAVLTPFGSHDVNRSYYGSDTRAQAILIGAALALGCALFAPVIRPRSRQALAGVGVLGALGVLIMWRFVPETSDFAFHGGFAVVSLAAAAVILCVTQMPRHPMSRGIGAPPLAYLGRISYGMYLWYWPVLLVITPERFALAPLELLALRIGVIVALAALSFHLVETPIRQGAWRGWRTWVALPSAASVLAVLALGLPSGNRRGGAACLADHSACGDAVGPGHRAAPCSDLDGWRLDGRDAGGRAFDGGRSLRGPDHEHGRARVLSQFGATVPRVSGTPSHRVRHANRATRMRYWARCANGSMSTTLTWWPTSPDLTPTTPRSTGRGNTSANRPSTVTC